MADTTIALEKLKAFWHSQVHDEEKWALNMLTLTTYKSFNIFMFSQYGIL
ncbi:hypothetical protein K2173_007072 [Erythroxylum novogranatense]|uniref:Uncharacterized protein n=1 Tax=Erythroxylum novogranatense TaxID=1862640 RepID=A0AAV8SKI0_9ROSI|nr:hypothetical protein K2173_007072 [Erythroxylum novogranatense]